MSSPSTSSPQPELRLRGIGVSPGIARGFIHFTGESFDKPDEKIISRDQVESEKERLKQAIVTTREQIAELQSEIETSTSDHAGIFDAHLLVLEDKAVIDEVIRKVETDLLGIDRVYFEVIDGYLQTLRKISDPYLRERAIDVEDVARRVVRNLRWPGGHGPSTREIDESTILAAHDLTPSDTVSLDRDRVLGFATEAGSSTSHTAIMARSLNIPAVVALHQFSDHLSPGDEALLDGTHGLLILRPSEETLKEYETLLQEENDLVSGLQELRGADTLTADGHKVILSGNIEFAHEVEQLTQQGAEGVGLYRTEFFYLNEIELRAEDKQAENYTTVAKSVAPHGVIIRTLDIGGDKMWPGLAGEPEPNPFLGWRGIRVSLAKPEEFKIQLRAILRASAFGKVGIMYPFLCNLSELRHANRLLDESKRELEAEGVAFDHDVETGAMIEIPSAALVAEQFAKEVDFFSIGTNDLIQYTTAVDRVNDRVADLYQPTHPAVISLITKTVEAAHNNDIWCGICGEAAGDLLLTPVFVGLGVDELSVGAAQLLRVRRAISRLDTAECRDFVAQIADYGCGEEVAAACREIAMDKYPELMG